MHPMAFYSEINEKKLQNMLEMDQTEKYYIKQGNLDPERQTPYVLSCM